MRRGWRRPRAAAGRRAAGAPVEIRRGGHGASGAALECIAIARAARGGSRRRAWLTPRRTRARPRPSRVGATWSAPAARSSRRRSGRSRPPAPGSPPRARRRRRAGVSPTTSASRGRDRPAEPGRGAPERGGARPARAPRRRRRSRRWRPGPTRSSRSSPPLRELHPRAARHVPGAEPDARAARAERLERGGDAREHRVAGPVDLGRGGARGSARAPRRRPSSEGVREEAERLAHDEPVGHPVEPERRERAVERPAALARAPAPARGARRRRAETSVPSMSAQDRPRGARSLRRAPPRTRAARTASGPRPSRRRPRSAPGA